MLALPVSGPSSFALFETWFLEGRPIPSKSFRWQSSSCYQAATSLRGSEACINLVFESQHGKLLHSHHQGTLSGEQQEQLPGELLEKKLGWLDQYKLELSRWQELSDMGQQICRHIRTEGYHAGSSELLRTELPAASSEQALQLREEMLAFVASESDKVPAEERLPGSSEVIESLIGKGKRLEGQQSQSGFTRGVLAMAGSVVKPTHQIIQAALKSIGMKHLKAWCTEHLPQSVQAKRRRDLGTQEKEQKQDKTHPVSTAML